MSTELVEGEQARMLRMATFASCIVWEPCSWPELGKTSPRDPTSKRLHHGMTQGVPMSLIHASLCRGPWPRI